MQDDDAFKIVGIPGVEITRETMGADGTVLEGVGKRGGVLEGTVMDDGKVAALTESENQDLSLELDWVSWSLHPYYRAIPSYYICTVKYDIYIVPWLFYTRAFAHIYITVVYLPFNAAHTERRRRVRGFRIPRSFSPTRWTTTSSAAGASSSGG